MHEPNVIAIVGHTFEVNFGDIIFHNTFESDSLLTYKSIKGGLGTAQTVNLRRIEIHPNAYSAEAETQLKFDQLLHIARSIRFN